MASLTKEKTVSKIYDSAMYNGASLDDQKAYEIMLKFIIGNENYWIKNYG